MNKVMLIGYVGQEPEVRYYDKDQCVARVRLATTERGYTLPNGTQVPDRTDWHNVIFFQRLAKVVEGYVHKGDKLYVEGRIRYRSYDDKKGMRRYVTEINAENMELLTPRRMHADGTQATAVSQQSSGSQHGVTGEQRNAAVTPQQNASTQSSQEDLPF